MTNLNQNGRSMIEMLGVLAIIGVLSVGGIAGYSKSMMKFKTNKTIDQIAMTVTNIRTLYAQQPYYDGLETGNAYKMGVTDDAMGTGSTLTNPFGGDVFIGTAHRGAAGEGISTSDYRSFLVTFAGLPREACVAIATNDWGSGYSSGLLGIATGKEYPSAAQNVACDVNGAATLAGTAGDKVVKSACAIGNTAAALSVDDAATGCDCGSNNTCFVTFKYY